MNRYRFLDEKGAHLHQLNVEGEWKPLIGTTTALQVLARPLTWWAAELAAVECLEAGEHIPSIRQEYLEAAGKFGGEKKAAIDALSKKYPTFKKARFAHYDKMHKAADTGTDLHAELEGYVRFSLGENHGIPTAHMTGEAPQVVVFVDWAMENVKRFIASEGHCYSERLWVGGGFDLLYEDKQGRIVLMDFKSSKDAYLSQFFQTAGYDIQIAESGVLDKDGNALVEGVEPISYYAVFPFGAEKPEPKFQHDTETMRQGFEAAVQIHKINTQYNG